MKKILTTNREHLLGGVLIGTILAVLAAITGTALANLQG